MWDSIISFPTDDEVKHFQSQSSCLTSTFKTTNTWMTENLRRRDKQIHCFSEHLSKMANVGLCKEEGKYFIACCHPRLYSVILPISVLLVTCPLLSCQGASDHHNMWSQLSKAEAGGFTVLPDICDVQMLSSLRGNQRPLLRNTHTAVASRCSIIIIIIVLLSRFASGIWGGKPY